MKLFYIEIAGLKIKIEHIYDCIKDYCKDYLSCGDICDFEVSVTQDDILFERKKSMEECAYEHIPYPNFPPDILEITAVYRKIAEKLVDYSAFVFHGSAVAVNGVAYLFTAKSGTGKTTHTNLWLKNIKGSYIVNGDKPVIRIKDDVVYICGTPWAGKEGLNRNVCIPLSSVCILDRGAENIISKIEFSEALPILIQQSYRPANSRGLIATMKLIESLGKRVKLYKLFCNMEDEAAAVSFEGMSHDKL